MGETKDTNRYIMKLGTEYPMIWTKALSKRKDMVECTADGIALSGPAGSDMDSSERAIELDAREKGLDRRESDLNRREVIIVERENALNAKPVTQEPTIVDENEPEEVVEDEGDKVPTKPEDQEVLVQAIMIAITSLDPEKDFTKMSGPRVEALERELGYDITMADRDAAWAAVNKD